MLSIGRITLNSRFWSSFTRPALIGFTSPSSSRGVAATAANSRKTADLLYKLDENVRRAGRVTSRDVLEVFEKVKEENFQNPTYGLLLLRCCGSLLAEEHASKRVDLVKQIWSALKSSDAKLDISHYNALLSVYIENEHPFNPTDILAELTESGLVPNRVTYQRLIRRYCQAGDIEGTASILKYMKEKNIPLNEPIFNSLIIGHGKTGDINAALGVLDKMKEAGIEPTNTTYKTLLCSLAELINSNNEAAGKIQEVLDKIEDLELGLSDKDYLEVVKALAIVDESSPLIDVVIEKGSKGAQFVQDSINIIYDLVNLHRLDTALKVFYRLPVSDRLREQAVAGNFLLNQMVKCDVDPKKVIKLCGDFKAKDINAHALRRVVEFAFFHSDLQTSKFYLNSFIQETNEQARVHYYWPLLVKSENEDQLFEILSKDMSGLAFIGGLRVLVETFMYVWPRIQSDFSIFYEKCKETGYSEMVLLTSYVRYLLKNKSLADVVDVLNQDRFINVRIASSVLCKDLAVAYCSSGDIESTVKVLEKFSSFRNGNFACGNVLNDIITIKGKDNALGVLFPLVQLMESSSIFISQSDCDRIKRRLKLSSEQEEQLLSITGDDASIASSDEESGDEGTSSVKYLTVSDLEKQLEEFRAKGITARGTQRQLLNLYCRQRFSIRTEEGMAKLSDLRKKVEALVEDYTKDGSELTLGMKALLMDFYSTFCEDLEAALKVKETLPHSVGLDAPKTIRLATLMCEKGKHEDAVKLLQEESLKMRPDKKFTTGWNMDQTDRDTARLLYAAGRTTKNFDVVKQLFDLAINLSGIRPSAGTLGPLVKVHILNGNFEKAMEQFKDAVIEHKCAPWKVDLMTHAIETGNTDHLQSITDNVMSLYGEANALLDLSIAFIKANKLKEAKKVLKTPGLRLNTNRVSLYAKSLAYEDVGLLESLITLTKDMLEIKKDQLYHELLLAHVKAGDIDKGLDVWTQMQENDVTPSNRTMQLLGNFLQQNGREVPFAFKQ